MSYIGRVTIAANQLVNTVLNGWPDETLSSRAHRQHLKGNSFWRNFINKLFYWQSDHCRGAHRDELERRQYPEDYRG
jgi:hypothetical protein